ncbi:ATP-dependent DNA ligase [Mycolicibacterium fortuitum]|uniref:ATP-dependent DNA ligase n=2 Tax=Mycolicibacterium fortuitum TaxID=1766 RepID=UPI0007EBAB61|nr:ATP-dependent DNA ligase [Mycolicibacterium fortuitum]OBA92667.1 ATP-dependent DNA ligase [Mycolicibacterium fortuitum]OBI55894.1 ATP-dependent DNA ligase [Mycolicibacterium fortuitum]
MLLPVMPPVSPMLAKPVTVIPPGASYEPKWDGFRALVFRDGDDVEFGSRNERPMTRYFPELVRAAKAELPPRCVVDGEIVLPAEKGLDFEALQLRLHPAASRVRLLAEHTPARFIAFDLLALGDANLMDRPFSERRAALAGALGSGPSFHVTPATTDIATARRWFDEFEGAGLDGLIAKKLDGPYLPGKREMVKVKHHRDADCVAIGYRIHKSGEGVGSILLGLYRADGELQMVGGAASFSVKDRLKLLADLEPLREGDEVREGDPSRWNSAADKRWIPVRPEKVCEVAYDQMEGNTDNGRRFRHAVKFMRWRPDREPSSCTFDQLDVPLNYDLYDVLAGEN